MDIGYKIKELRNQNNLTLEELANRSELSKGFLSQLERNLTSPSIATLKDILEVLGSDLATFFQENKKERIIFSEDDYYINEKDGATIHWIVPNAQKNAMEPLILTLKKDCISQVITPHNGEELGYILEGSITLIDGGIKYPMNKGETFYIQGNHKHYIKNIGLNDARILWVMTPPNF